MDEQKPRIVVSPNPKKESIVIDINGNVVSSKNPNEAQIVSKPLFDKDSKQ